MSLPTTTINNNPNNTITTTITNAGATTTGSPTLEETLQEIEARFLYNLPSSELETSDRLFFQIEAAYWFYEDYKADKYPHLPHFKNLRKFAEKVFLHCDLLKGLQHRFHKLFTDFSAYKSQIPVCGCIILNTEMNKFLLVQDANTLGWTFPRGKLNENEDLYECALREVQEEIGYQPSKENCRKEDHLISFHDGKPIILFIATNVAEDTDFSIQCKKEIADIQFFPIGGKSMLPENVFHVEQFLDKLKRWIKNKRKELGLSQSQQQVSSAANVMLSPGRIKIKQRAHSDGGGGDKGGSKSSSATTTTTTNTATAGNNASVATGKLSFQSVALEETQFRVPPSSGKGNNTGRGNGNSSSGGGGGIRNDFDQRNADTFEDEEKKRWTVKAMFQANAALTGKEYRYDGNPHDFGSSHPRYINYSAHKMPTAEGGGGGSDRRNLYNASPEADLAFSLLSQQSYQQGEALLRGRTGVSSDGIAGSGIKMPIFPSITLNVEDVMTAVDRVLRDKKNAW